MLAKIAACMVQVMAPVAQGALETLAGGAITGDVYMGVKKFLLDRFHSGTTLQNALRHSFEQAIDTMQVAVAGPRFYHKSADKEFARNFYDKVLIPFLNDRKLGEKEFVDCCIRDLKTIRPRCREVVPADPIFFADMAEEAAKFATQDPHHLTHLESLSTRDLSDGIRELTRDPHALAELVEYENVLVGAASMHFGRSLEKDEGLFRAFFIVNHSGLRREIQCLAAKIEETKATRDRRSFDLLSHQKLMLAQIEEHIEFGLTRVGPEITAAFDARFQRWDDRFGDISGKLDSLLMAGKETLADLGRMREMVSEVKSAVDQVDQKQDALLDEIRKLREQIEGFKSARSVSQKAVLSHSLLVRPEEKNLVDRLVGKFRSLQEKIKGKTAFDLCVDLGSLLTATGQTKEAQQVLERAQSFTGNADDRALVLYNNFVNCVEAEDFADAIARYHDIIATGSRKYQLFEHRKYRPLQVLGAGGFGVVFFCHSEVWGKVVVKALSQPQSQENIDVVMEEARALARSKSPYIISLKDFGYVDWEHRQGPFIAMEYFEGENLESYLDKCGNLPFSRAIEVARTIAEGLLDAHNMGVIHRDLKPANILYRDHGATFDLKIIDFGLATLAPELGEVARSITTTNAKSLVGSQISGTLQYAPPEQKGEEVGGRLWPVGRYSDVFTFGRTLKKILFGTLQPHPRDLDNFENRDLLYLIGDCESPDPRRRPADFSRVLDLLSRTGTARKPRPKDAAQPAPVSPEKTAASRPSPAPLPGTRTSSGLSLRARSMDGKLELFEDGLFLGHSGAARLLCLLLGVAPEQKIRYNEISSVEFHPAKFFSPGYIRLQRIGEVAKGWTAWRRWLVDENKIRFTLLGQRSFRSLYQRAHGIVELSSLYRQGSIDGAELSRRVQSELKPLPGRRLRILSVAAGLLIFIAIAAAGIDEYYPQKSSYRRSRTYETRAASTFTAEKRSTGRDSQIIGSWLSADGGVVWEFGENGNLGIEGTMGSGYGNYNTDGTRIHGNVVFTVLNGIKTYQSAQFEVRVTDNVMTGKFVAGSSAGGMLLYRQP